MKTKKNVIVLMTMPDCANDDENLRIANKHFLTPEAYNTMVESFFAPAVPLPKVIMMNDPKIDLTLNCQFYGIKIKFDPTDHTTNMDIDVSMALISSLSTPHDDYFVMFSIHHFKGLKNGKSATRLELRKAYRNENGTNVPTITIKSMDMDGNTVHLSDLSSMIPIPI